MDTRSCCAGTPRGILRAITFRVEGGLLKDRMRWPLGDELQRQYEVECAGLECNDASEIIALVRGDIPTLNEVRAEMNGGNGRLLLSE